MLFYGLLLLVIAFSALILLFREHLGEVGRITGMIDKSGRDILVEFISNKDLSMIGLFIMGSVIIIFFVQAVFITHKIVGPITHLKRHFRDLSEKKSYDNISFRRHDKLKDLAEEVNRYLNAIKPQG